MTSQQEDLSNESPASALPQEIRQIERLALIAAILSSAVVLLTPFLPYLDYPNHVARFALLGKFQNTALFNEFYRVNPIFVPNLGFDLLAVNLSKILPADLATRLILACCLFSASFGWAKLLLRLVRQPLPLVVAIPLFTVSYSLYTGFLNFLLGMAIMPWIVWWYRSWLESKRLAAYALFFGLAIGCFVSHALSAMLSILVAVAVSFLWEIEGVKRRSPIVGWSVPPVLLMGVLLKLSPSSGEFSRIEFGTLKHKLAIPLIALKGPTWKFDFAIYALVAIVLLISLVLKAAKWDRKGLLLAGFLLASAIATPTALAVAANLDHRLGYFFPMLIAASAISSTNSVRIATVALALVGVRSVWLGKHALQSAAVCSVAQTALLNLPEDSVVFNLPLGRDTNWRLEEYNPAILNLPHVALWKRPMMISGLYSYPTQQPLVYSEVGTALNFLGLAPNVSFNTFHGDILTCRNRLNMTGRAYNERAYAFVSSLEGLPTPIPEGLQEVARGPKFWIFRILPTDVASQP